MLPRLVQFRGEKQALGEERGDTAAFFFLVSRAVSPLTDGDHKSDRRRNCRKELSSWRNTRYGTRRATTLYDGIRRGKEEGREEKRMGNVISHDEVEMDSNSQRQVRNARLLASNGINVVCRAISWWIQFALLQISL